MAYLLDFAFRKLIGVKGVTPGLRTIHNAAFPPLMDIAPAVWDPRYLQTIYTHAQLIPSIASGVSRLRNARSDTLRRKLDHLARRGVRGNNGQELVDLEAKIGTEVQRRLWLLCQTRIRPGLSRRPFATTQAEEDAIEEPLSQLGSEGQERQRTPLYEANVNLFTAIEDHDVPEGQESYGGSFEVFAEPDLAEIGACGWTSDRYMLENEAPSSCELTPSSEGDYFYTDGQGNLYPIEREAVAEEVQTDWASTTQPAGHDDSSQQQDEEIDGYCFGDPCQAYIMYQEDRSPDVAGHIRTNTAARHLFLSWHPDDMPSSDHAEDQNTHNNATNPNVLGGC
ncbi:hypothetical protein C7999DRAFT_41557 [Corynascus novoguineensis]|uniref:Uncharacterized protein n=1 Tax=Corynascus novoguineensis TaxID=1126955 RepID=A0AAN7CSC7_9PEZI|nr:hypothetical protein C7999DRAFT_41557 [Corynascus novoguineensis]